MASQSEELRQLREDVNKLNINVTGFRVQLHKQNERIDDLQKKINDLVKVIQQLQGSKPSDNNVMPPKALENKPPKNPDRRQPPKIAVPAKSITQNIPSSEVSKYVNDYNALSEMNSGYEAVQARKDFSKSNNVVGFSCVNFEARMNDPIPPAIFKSLESAQSGDFWAIPLQNSSYLVFPNITTTYTDNVHTARAMCEVFDSNFESGNVYKKIHVVKPAIFEKIGDTWTCTKNGLLDMR